MKTLHDFLLALAFLTVLVIGATLAVAQVAPVPTPPNFYGYSLLALVLLVAGVSKTSGV